jgi:L-iditol 2-dehydrogenase
MKAAVFHKAGDLRIENVPQPVLGEGDILLKVGACAICGTDMRIFRHGHAHLATPTITGHEISGIVADKGKKVEGYDVGDKVVVDPIVSCGFCRYCAKGLTNLCIPFKRTTEAFGYFYPGGFAEYMAIPAKAVGRGNLVKVPGNLGLDEAAIAEPMACALNAQMMSGVGIGDHVLVVGAGPIGCMHVSLAKTLGATKVMISEFQETRLALARRFGPDRCINPEKEDLGAAVAEETGGVGPTVVMIAAPAKKAQEESLGLAASRARINFFGGLPMDDSIARVDSNLVHYKELSIQGTSGTTRSHISMCLELMAGGRVDGKKFISRTVPLEELPSMMREALEGKYLKIVVKP